MYLYTYKFVLICIPSSNYSQLTSVATAVHCSKAIRMIRSLSTSDGKNRFESIHSGE